MSAPLRRLAPSLLFLLASACGEDGTQHVPPPPAAVGSVRVTWSIATTSGEAISCGALGAERAQVLLGGKEVFVPCGEAEEAIFDNLTPGRYPVIVRLLRLGTAVLLEEATNTVVAGDAPRAEVAVRFTFDPNLGTSGDLVVRWRLDDAPASSACAAAGGETVLVEDLPGSRAELSATAPCTAGQVTFTGIPAGDYGILLILRDAAGATLFTASIPMVQVPSGDVARPQEVPFLTGGIERARLHAEWTVNGTVAAAGCDAAGADAVFLRAYPDRETVATVTATAACADGRITLADVPPGPRRHRVFFQLYSGYFTDPPLPRLLTSTSALDVLFLRGQTSSVSVDLDAGAE